MLNHFTFNGHSTGELGLLVSGINIYGSPSRIVEKVTIPYRSGDLLIDTGAYTNYMLTYTVDIMDNTKATAEAISKWLLGSKGYCELTDTYNPEIYRVASYYNQLDYTLSALYRYGKATITFDCKPQKYLTANQSETLSSTLSEETSYSLSTPAMPLPLTLEGNTTQGANPSPSSPQAIHSVSGDNEIKVINKNLFDIENDYVNTKFSLSGGTLFNTATDTRTYFFLSILALNGNTVVSVIYANSFSTTGEKSVTFNSGDLSNVTRLRLKHNGSSNDLEIAYVEKSSLMANTSYTLSFNLISNNPTTVNGLIIGNFQLEVGSTATPYEPYKAQVYPINLPVDNLFNKADGENNKNFDASGGLVSGTHFISNYISVLPNTTYYLSNVVSAYNGRSAFAYDSNKATPRVIIFSDTNATSGTFTTGSAEVYVRVCTDTPDICQLEKGSKANSYTPYGVAPIELNALSTYKDYIHKENGKWYLHKEFDKVDMGTIEWATETTYLTGMFRTGTGSTPSVPLFAGALACPIFIWQEGAVDFRNLKDGYMAVTNSADLPIVRVRNSIYSSYTNAQFKEAMSGIPMYYTLKTPTETEITDATLVSQLNAISKAKTYDGSTTIVQEGTDAGFKLSMPVPTEITSEYFGEPIITVNEVGTIVWNDSLIKVNSAPVTINSQTLQCYYYSENKNNDVEINEFPKYEQGENYIGSTMALTVVPNYWKL